MTKSPKILSRDDITHRIENAYELGLLTPERLRLLEKWVDFVLRFEGGQMNYVCDFLLEERNRTGAPTSTGAIGRLAGDEDGYALVRLTAILAHPCQICATDRHAWHTRSGFCEHKKAE